MRPLKPSATSPLAQTASVCQKGQLCLVNHISALKYFHRLSWGNRLSSDAPHPHPHPSRAGVPAPPVLGVCGGGSVWLSPRNTVPASRVPGPQRVDKPLAQGSSGMAGAWLGGGPAHPSEPPSASLAAERRPQETTQALEHQPDGTCRTIFSETPPSGASAENGFLKLQEKLDSLFW